MTKRSRAEEEPYTFAGKDLRGGLVGSEARFDATEAKLLKDSVAAHQAECGCHRIVVGPVDDCCERSASADARDMTGHPWHVDPLCKVRPEAKA